MCRTSDFCSEICKKRISVHKKEAFLFQSPLGDNPTVVMSERLEEALRQNHDNLLMEERRQRIRVLLLQVYHGSIESFKIIFHQ